MALATGTGGKPPAVAFVIFMIDVLYGGAAGMFIRRFSIQTAVAIPVSPAILLIVLCLASIPPTPEASSFPIIIIIISFVAPTVVSTGLAFWLHSRWARKQRMPFPAPVAHS